MQPKANTENPKPGHECLGFCVCVFSPFLDCVSFSSLRVVNTQNVSYTLLYHPHTTGKRPSSFFFRFCGDARGYYVFYAPTTTTFFRFVETPPPFETFSTIHTFAFGRRIFGDGVFGDEETMETLVRERERRLWAFDDDDDDDGFFVVVVLVVR